MELLAPAGGMEQLRAAVAFGADAVYLAAERFGMRARAANFRMDEIPAAVAFAHEHGVKVHVTCNILMHPDDIDGLPAFFRALDAAGVDAFIIGDLGAAAIARRVAPRVALHVSTQASVANSEAARVWYSLGASRVVCAREMSLDDISRMREDMPADMEIEAFAHGAMCMAVSGRCLISSYLTGRSGNKGFCAQPCRWSYALVEEKRPGAYYPIEEDLRGTYVMNAHDLCMIEHLGELADAGGAFCSAQDADSEGEEGKYYLFSYGELLSVLGEQTGRAFCDYYGVTEQGNFEGKNILNRLHADPAGSAFDAALPVLRAYRRARAALHLDDKILSAWNGLMIAALACLFRATGREKYLAAARRARDFIEANMMRDGRLFTSFRAGVLSGAGYLDDYAFYAAGLLELYAASGCADDLNRAQRVCAAALERFQDPAGGFCLSGADGERLVLRPKEVYDGALPSGNAVMAYNLVRLSQLTDEARWEQAAQRQLDWLAAAAAPYPAGHCMSMLALLVQRNPPPRVTVVLAPGEDRACAAARLPLYADTSVLDAPSEQYKLLNSRTTYYICRGRVCLPPSNTPEGL